MNDSTPTTAPAWTSLLSPGDWSVWQSAIEALRTANVEFLVGGALALAFYTERLRRPTDLDFMVLPSQVSPAIAALTKAGFTDHYAQRPYDRGSMYQASRDGFVVDLIFRMANGRAEVDLLWFAQARELVLFGEPLKISPPEEMIWRRLYIMRRDRCDWPDIINLLCALTETLDWNHLFNRVGEDLPLLRAVVNLNDWLCHESSGRIPSAVRQHLRLPSFRENGGEKAYERRIEMLDARSWFAASHSPDQLLEI